MPAVTEQFGEQVRVQGQTNGGSMTELVFNPTTGEFEQRPKGTSGAGDVVTDMTKGGFA
jgi:hypothetical protein